MSGDGNYGGNGSVWFENHINNVDVGRGTDPIEVPDTGNGRGNFQLFLRYTTEAKPIGALQGLLRAGIADMQNALNRLERGDTDVSVHLEVPVIPRTAAPAGQDANWEVKVKW